MLLMQKIKVLPYSRAQIDGTLPETDERERALVSHLQPVIDYLLSNGNELEYPLAYGESDCAPVDALGGGWQQYPEGDSICSMKRPINFEDLKMALDLPPSITIFEDQKMQSIACQDVRAAIRYYKL